MKVTNYKVPEFMLKHHAFDHLQPMWQKDMWLFLGLGVLSCVLYWLFGFLAPNHQVWLSVAPALIVLLILNIRRCKRLWREKWWNGIYAVSFIVYDAIVWVMPAGVVLLYNMLKSVL